MIPIVHISYFLVVFQYVLANRGEKETNVQHFDKENIPFLLHFPSFFV